MKTNIYKTVERLLKNTNKYISEDNKLLKAKLYEDIIRMDEQLLDILLSDNLVKETFFKKVKDTLVFDKQKFARFVESKEFLEDSYTSYINKIGLTSNGEFILNSNDVVLDFPFKDCYLYGGQDKDDQKRKEIFYNELIASDDIRQMLAPKVLGNAKRYTKNGVEETSEFDENDNLIIKGNNLIALASLLKRYEGKVKSIYIDPPYNTGNDSFNYNDKFNHSSWLVFMKNRLELAKRLLRDDGVIFVQCDDNEQAYLKVLMDEIFGRKKFVNHIIWRYRTYIGQTKMFFPRKHDSILFYKKNEISNFNLSYVGNFEDTPDFKRWLNYFNEKGEILYGNHPKNDSRFDAYLNKYVKQFGSPEIGDIIYINKGYVVDDVWEDLIALDAKNKSERIDSFGGSGQKPEALIERIIGSTTLEGDIILDFFLGSGTTAAVAHKMNRRYIGIEQMDYIQDITVERLKKVIDGEQGGISKSVNWQGGGSFVYCELLENAQQLINDIQKSYESNILELKNKIFNDERVIPHITRSELEEYNQEFENLSLEDKKKVLIKIIDKNKLYINYSEINDKDYNIQQSDKYFSNSFYKGE
ncbi:DNA methyltransferase [Mycoplasma mycoides]|uniref:DNA methyltransferase n=1 Tax=Mycoplasma mycoides TaxID=2102 RepID=UPI00223E93BB|nr:site-specific DNA-methyltransferase [Mycoplasma mycoides]